MEMRVQSENVLKRYNCYFGTDPELFVLDKDGNVVGSEKVIPKDGYTPSYGDHIVRDGVQVEFNPEYSHCREVHANRIRNCFIGLKHLIDVEQRRGSQFQISLASMVEVRPKELASLDPEAQKFGCKPSFNVYNNTADVGADGRKYLKRAAGGHLHFGNLPYSIWFDHTIHSRYGVPIGTKDADHRRRLVPLFDVLIGNTGVLLDRDPNQVERRKHYGRAGEFRLPKHGIEYRTLSNFWLRNYALFGLMTGLGRMAISVLAQTVEGKGDMEKALLEHINFEHIVKAIDTNDAKLAWKNFTHVETFIREHVKNPGGRLGWSLYPGNIDKFKTLARKVQRDGLESVFTEDPIQHWTTLSAVSSGKGWESYLRKFTKRKG
jgi:hypothetical protein